MASFLCCWQIIKIRISRQPLQNLWSLKEGCHFILPSLTHSSTHKGHVPAVLPGCMPPFLLLTCCLSTSWIEFAVVEEKQEPCFLSVHCQTPLARFSWKALRTAHLYKGLPQAPTKGLSYAISSSPNTWLCSSLLLLDCPWQGTSQALTSLTVATQLCGFPERPKWSVTPVLRGSLGRRLESKPHLTGGPNYVSAGGSCRKWSCRVVQVCSCSHSSPDLNFCSCEFLLWDLRDIFSSLSTLPKKQKQPLGSVEFSSGCKIEKVWLFPGILTSDLYIKENHWLLPSMGSTQDVCVVGGFLQDAAC